MTITRKIAALAVASALAVGGLAFTQSATAAEIPGEITITPTSGSESGTFLTSIAVSVGAPVGFRALGGTFVYQDGVELGAISNARFPQRTATVLNDPQRGINGKVFPSTAGTTGLDGNPASLNRTIIPTNNYVSNKALNQLTTPLADGLFELRYYYFASATAPNRATDPYVSLRLRFDDAANTWSVVQSVTPDDVTRIAGADRFATSAAVAQEFTTADVVYVANGRNFPDALSAAPAAAFQNAPLLLTERDTLPSVIAAEITRLAPERIVVVGGEAVVSPAVLAALDALSNTDDVDRLGGVSRFETSRLITADAFPASTTTTAFLATGANFPDALSASAAGAFRNAPVILVDSSLTALDTPTQTLLDSLGTTTQYIVGGTAVISNLIELSAGPGTTRLAGADRYGTSVAINEGIFTEALTVYIAVGTGFADALSGAALAGSNNSPLFVVPSNCIPQAVLDSIDSLGAANVVLFGGDAVLSEDVANLTACTV